MKVQSAAAVCHEANRRYCKEIGDDSQKPWEEASYSQKQSAIAGVIFVMQNPDAAPSAAHDNWLKRKLAEGWTQGEVKDEDAKTHPCCIPYDQLPDKQKVKDTLFVALVKILTKGEEYAG